MPELWKHQEAIVSEVLAHMPGGYGVFAQMRVGKSRIAIEVARRLEARRILVLCPSQAGAVPLVWKREAAAQWPGGPRIVVLAGTTRERAAQLERLDGQPCIVIVNYESAWHPPLGPTFEGKRGRVVRAAGSLLRGEWDVLIADEIHRVGAHNGAQQRAVATIARRIPARLGLTGTPIPHSILSVWGEFQVIDPSVFQPTFTAFRMNYSRPAARDEQRDPDTYMQPGIGGTLTRWKFQNLDELRERMAAHSVRALTRDVFPDMPPELDDERVVELEPAARRIYRDMARTMVAELKDGTISSSANAGVRILRLAQITGGTLASENLETGATTKQVVSTAKADLLREMLIDLGDEPVVIYGRFHADLDAALGVCAELGITACELSGRVHALEPWQAGAAQVLVGQIQAAGSGIDLSRASVVIYFSTGHSLNDYIQSRSRILGPKQTKPAIFYHLIVANSVDELIVAALRARADVVDYVVERMRAE